MTIPLEITGTGWLRLLKLERFVGDSLFEYIDGAAEMYHKYDFVEVIVATYIEQGNTITADLYRFEGPDRAFGMYTTLRPDEPDTVAIGVEGFRFGANLVFVRGSHLVNVYTYDDFEGMLPALRSIASALNDKVPGTLKKPDVFSLFPERGRIRFTEKIFAEGFLSHGFLTDVHTVDYSIDGERARLFMTSDPAGEKLAQWLDTAGATADAAPGWESEIFGEGKALRINHDYHGEIVAGWRGGKLVGVIGYLPAYRDAFVNWARSFE
jgi:hypothetical protein